jgi:hypothetical protein
MSLGKRLYSGLSASALLLGAMTAAHADVVISTDPTSNMSCASGVCTPTAADAVLNASDLETYLASGSLEVTTTGSGVQANNIDVTAPFSWSATNTLTLDAFRSVTISAAVSDGGSGGLTLTTKDGGTKGALTFPGGSITFANTSNALVINATSYTLVSSIAALASAVSANPKGKYALANNYDASGDGTYAHPPVPTELEGTFEGLGNTISNLSINDTTDANVGLFAETGRFGSIKDLGLSLAATNVTGNPSTALRAGTLVGLSEGNISHTSASGSAVGCGILGGLIGESTGEISSSSSSVTINGSCGGGGLAFYNDGKMIDSSASGDVEGGDGSGGGLVAYNLGLVERSYATGAVSSTSHNTCYECQTEIGGLAAENDGWIISSHATGTVSFRGKKGNAGAYAGGLVGNNALGLVELSFATGAIAGGDGGAMGGFVGLSSGTIANCYGSGSATAKQDLSVGAFAGILESLYGEPPAVTKDSYSAGVPAGKKGQYSYLGGFAGQDVTFGGTKKAYWDTTTSGQQKGTGNRGNEPGLKGLTTTELQSGLPKGFDPAIWAENPSINNGFPYLIANPPPQ